MDSGTFDPIYKDGEVTEAYWENALGSASYQLGGSFGQSNWSKSKKPTQTLPISRLP